MKHTIRSDRSSIQPIIKADLFASVDATIKNSHSTIVIVPHVCNNANLFGVGFAAAVANHYPIVKDNYHLLGKPFLSKNLGYAQFILAKENKSKDNKLIFANMIAQNGTISKNNPRPINYFSLCKSMNLVAKKAHDLKSLDTTVQIHAPKFGSGLAGGNWLFISHLIEDIWGDLEVFVYDIGSSRS